MALTRSDLQTPLITENYWIDALITRRAGDQWNLNFLEGIRETIRYSFAVPADYDRADYSSVARSTVAETALTQRDDIRRALAYITELTGIGFVESPAAEADLFFLNGDVNGGFTGIASWSYSYSYSVPSEVITGFNSFRAIIHFDIADHAAINTNPSPGTYGYQVILHELGHFLGLKHPFEGTDVLDPSLDNTDNTLMSYTISPPYHQEFRPFDTAALLFLYGEDGIGGSYGSTSDKRIIQGTPAADIIHSTERSDLIGDHAGSADDDIDGGAGRDGVRLDAPRTQYSLSIHDDHLQLTSRDPAGSGSDRLMDIEFLEFTTGGYDLAPALKAAGVSDPELQALTELYVAYFNRAPDGPGLVYWAGVVAEGLGLDAIAAYFFDQPETRDRYPNPEETETFVGDVYENVLGRAPDAGGFAYWVELLDSGAISPDTFVLLIIEGAKAATGGPWDAEYLERKGDLGVYFAAIKGLTDGNWGEAVMDLYDGSAASVTAARNLIDSYFQTATSEGSGEFLVNLAGVATDPFAGLV